MVVAGILARSTFRNYQVLAHVQTAFRSLLEQWREASAAKSDVVAVLMHPAHYRIIALGRAALPHILRDMRDGGGPWFTALEAITGETVLPQKPKASARELHRAWMDWARKHGYLKD